MNRRAILMVLSVVIAASCGERQGNQSGSAADPVSPLPTTGPSVVPIIPTTTMQDVDSIDVTVPSFDEDDVLPPEGALVVVDIGAGETLDGLPPGTYRVRLAYQREWPERCLSEAHVLDTANATPPLEGGAVDEAVLAAQHELARELERERLRLQEPICGEYWSEFEQQNPLPEPAPEVDGPPAPTTTAEVTKLHTGE